MPPLLAARVYVAIGGTVTAILIATAILWPRHRGAAGPDQPTAQTAPGRAPAAPGAAAIAARSPEIAPGGLRLEGRTVDDRQRPIAGARVTLDGTSTTESADDGSFAFDGLAAADHALTGERGVAYGEQTVSLDEHAGAIELRLEVGSNLVVHIVDRAGAPLAGATVTLFGRHDVQSDRDGKATFRSKPGNLFVHASKPGYASRQLAIRLGEDPRTTLDRTMVLGPTAPIGGRVIDEHGAPIAGALVQVERIEDGHVDEVQADDQGQWRMDGFGAGRLRLVAFTGGSFSAPEPLVDFDAAAPRLDLVIHLQRGGTITGVALDADGRPAADARVAVNMDSPPILLSVPTDDHGRFSFTGVPPGQVMLDASTDTLASPVQTVALENAGRADVVLRMVDSAIEGTVANVEGQPVANATVSVLGPDSANATSDESGHFALHHLPIGSYQVIVTRDAAADRWLGLANGHPVQAHSGDRHVALVLPDVTHIIGRVLLDGHPVERFGVAADAALLPEPQNAPDGRFDLEVQASTEWPELRYLVIAGPGFRRRVFDDGVFVGPGQTTDLGDIVVTAGKTVRGRVVLASGTPVVGAAVVVQAGGKLEAVVSLSKWADGSCGAFSDAAGQFEISGLPDDLADVQIQAQHPDLGLALPRALTDLDFAGGVRLVLAATGAVAGTVLGDTPRDDRQVHVVARSDGRDYVTPSNAGAFSIAQLPAGDYTASLAAPDAPDAPGAETADPPVPFHVAAGQTARVEILGPP